MLVFNQNIQNIMSELTLEKKFDLFFKSMEKFKERQEAIEKQRDKDYELFLKRQKKTESTLNGLGLSCGVTAETFFIEGTEDGITIDKHTFKQDLSNYEVRKWIGKKLKTFTEIDLVLSTDDIVFLIETKYRIDEKQHEECEKKFALFQEHEQDYIAGRKIYKGIASLGVKKDMKEFYKEKGYFILTQKGDNIKVFNPF